MTNEIATSNGFELRIATLNEELTQATDDFDRLRIRDLGKAAQEAAGILKYRLIEVKASHLVCDAERAMARANPPRQGERTDIEDFGIPNPEVEQPVKPHTIRDFRKAHDNIPEAEYQEAKKDSIIDEVPLTRAALKDKARVPNTYMARTTGEYEWYTPGDCIEKVRRVLSEIELDPASCEMANEMVRATCIYTESEDGLSQDWSGKVFMNPPFRIDLVTAFVDKLLREYPGRVSDEVLLVNSCTETEWFASAICFPKGRVKFVSPEGKRKDSHRPQTFFYFGGNAQRFVDVFQELGVCNGGLGFLN